MRRLSIHNIAALVASTLGSGAPEGMNIVDRWPVAVAARATPCAWFPALAATTAHPSANREMAMYAPRTLYDPVP